MLVLKCRAAKLVQSQILKYAGYCGVTKYAVLLQIYYDGITNIWWAVN